MGVCFVCIVEFTLSRKYWDRWEQICKKITKQLLSPANAGIQKKTNRYNAVPLVYLHSFSVAVQFESQIF